jgi:hypothetical protein
MEAASLYLHYQLTTTKTSIMDTIRIDDCIVITNDEWIKLVRPEYVGQTKPDSNDMFYMVWRHEGKNYATHNKL